MYVNEVIEHRPELEDKLWEMFCRNNSYVDNKSMFLTTTVLIPTDENTDYNGSNYTANGDVANFTYRDVDYDDVDDAVNAGWWDYFGRYEYDTSIYTGNQYETDDSDLFPAIVLDPPAYAIEVYF